MLFAMLVFIHTLIIKDKGAIFNLGRYKDLLVLFAKSPLCQTEDLLSIFEIVSGRFACCEITFLYESFPRELFQSDCEAVTPIYRKIDRDYLSFATIVSLLTVA